MRRLAVLAGLVGVLLIPSVAQADTLPQICPIDQEGCFFVEGKQVQFAAASFSLTSAASGQLSATISGLGAVPPNPIVPTEPYYVGRLYVPGDPYRPIAVGKFYPVDPVTWLFDGHLVAAGGATVTVLPPTMTFNGTSFGYVPPNPI